MKTLHSAYRVSNLADSLDFYSALGYSEVGRVDLGDGASLTMLKLPSDEFVSLEIVHRRRDGAVDRGGFSHLAVQVDDLASTVARLVQLGLEPGPIEYPGGPAGAMPSWLVDPDGYRLELVQWPPGHPAGMTARDFGFEP